MFIWPSWRKVCLVCAVGSVTSVEILFLAWTRIVFGVGTGVEILTGCSGGNFRLKVSSGNWCGASVVEVGCAVEGRGRFVRGVCGN